MKMMSLKLCATSENHFSMNVATTNEVKYSRKHRLVLGYHYTLSAYEVMHKWCSVNV